MMFIPQGNGAVSAVPVNTGTVSQKEMGEPDDANNTDMDGNQNCKDIVGGTGGVHLIRRKCPQPDLQIRESIAANVRNERDPDRSSRCGGQDPDWPLKPHTAEPVIDVVVINAKGTFAYNKRIVSRDQLMALLRLKAQMSASPAVLLRHDASATCSDVSAIRDLMRRTLDCAAGKCVEGSTWNWVPDEGFNGFDGAR